MKKLEYHLEIGIVLFGFPFAFVLLIAGAIIPDDSSLIPYLTKVMAFTLILIASSALSLLCKYLINYFRD